MHADNNKRIFHCQQAVLSMYAFIDGEMSPDDCATLQHHLDECSPCLEAFEFEAELKMVVAKRCRDDMPESVVMKVTQALMVQIKNDELGKPSSD